MHLKFDEVGTTLKHLETINGNVKKLGKMIENEIYGECHFYFKNLTLLLNILYSFHGEALGPLGFQRRLGKQLKNRFQK